MSEAGRESFEARPNAGDAPAAVDRTEALSERFFGRRCFTGSGPS